MIPSVRIIYNGARVRLAGPGFHRDDNIKIIEAGFQSVKDRLARGIGSDDAPAKVLSKAYARRKIRGGRAPIRDLRFTGDLLDREIKLRYADDNGAVMDAGSRVGRTKARLNREELLFSENDQHAMSDVAGGIFRDQVYTLTGPRDQFQRGNEFSR